MFRLRFPDGDREYRSIAQPPTVGMEISARGRRWQVDHVDDVDIFLTDVATPDFEMSSMSVEAPSHPLGPSRQGP
jgi:hypothetical protein